MLNSGENYLTSRAQIPCDCVSIDSHLCDQWIYLTFPFQIILFTSASTEFVTQVTRSRFSRYWSKMAESSNQLTGLDKSLLDAKIEPGKESKRKRKRSKNPPAQAQSNETSESQSKNQPESLTCVEQNVAENNEDSKLHTEGTSQIVLASDTSGTANTSKEFNPPDNEKMTKEETTQGHGDLEECMSKDVQHDLKTIQEQRSEEKGSKFEQVKQDHASNSKFGKFAFHRSKKVKISTKKSSVDEDKQTSDPSGETTAVKIVTVEGNTKTPERQVNKPGEAKLETSPSSADNEDASKSPEGVQEKPQSKNNKGKKLKQLANFGRNKKKYEIAFKLDETSNETNEENLVHTPGRFQRSRSTSSQPFQNTEIVGNESKTPVAAASSDFNNENTNDGKDEGTEIERKRGGKQKKKGPVLGFKRSKSQPKTKPSKSGDKQNTEGNPSKESDDVSAGTRNRPEGENKAGFEESNEDSKANKSEAADLKREETEGAATELTQEISDKEETKRVESKEIVPPAHEDSTQVTPKEEKRENILRRRLRKLKSPGNILQSRKKLHEDENSVEVTGNGVKTAEQADKRASPELEQTAEEQTPVAEDNDEKECSDNEGTSQAVKRKTSDLKTNTRALKKKKEDGENIIEIEFNEELSETALAIIEEKNDQNIYEEVDVLSDLKSFKEIKDLTEAKELSVDEVNEEMSQQKNVMEELEENKERKVDEEISSASLARDDTKTEEEVSKEARRKSHKLMQTVIHELTELIKKKEENKAAEIEIQVEEREERVNFSDRETAVRENQQLSSTLDDNGLEHEPDEESSDSDITVVTVKTLSSHESLVEHKTEPNTEDEEVRAIAEGVSPESETPSGTEPLDENESKPDTKDEARAVAEEAPLETKTPQVTETPENDQTKPNTEDKEIGAITEIISKEIESMEPIMETEERPAISEDASSEAEAPQESELAVENEIKQETEERKIKSFTDEVSSGTDTSTAGNEDSQVHVPKAEAWTEHKTDTGTEPEEIHDINEAGETSQTEPNQEDSIEAANINPEELVPESRAEHNTKPATENEDVKDFTDAGKSSPKFKGRMVQVKVLNESEVSSKSNELETITKANEVDEIKEEEDEDVGQNKEVESYQATSSQGSVEEWTMVHRADLSEEISRQIKHSLVFNSLRRSYTSCCTIM